MRLRAKSACDVSSQQMRHRPAAASWSLPSGYAMSICFSSFLPSSCPSYEDQSLLVHLQGIVGSPSCQGASLLSPFTAHIQTDRAAPHCQGQDPISFLAKLLAGEAGADHLMGATARLGCEVAPAARLLSAPGFAGND